VKYMATLRNGMVIGPVIKVDQLPYGRPRQSGYTLDVKDERTENPQNIGCFIGTNGFPETHLFQWYGINFKQITGCPQMDIMNLKEIES